jgi:hypothetical protein
MLLCLAVVVPRLVTAASNPVMAVGILEPASSSDLDCPHHCSGHGVCEGGACKCFPGYTYYDCSLRESRQPRARITCPRFESRDLPLLRGPQAYPVLLPPANCCSCPQAVTLRCLPKRLLEQWFLLQRHLPLPPWVAGAGLFDPLLPQRVLVPRSLQGGQVPVPSRLEGGGLL